MLLKSTINSSSPSKIDDALVYIVEDVVRRREKEKMMSEVVRRTVLDVEKGQYTPWATLFPNTAKAYNVLDHIDSLVTKPTDVDDALWGRLDAIVCQWLYGTITTDLLLNVLDDKSTAMTAWERLRNIFQDNKGTRLAAIDHPISEERLVLQLVGKLTSDYLMVSTLIQQSTPLPIFDKACSMLELDRVSREKPESGSVSSDTVLLAGSNPSPPSQPSASGLSHGHRTGYGRPNGKQKGKYKGKSQGGPNHHPQGNAAQPMFYSPWANS
ncbi:uncharacterized protein LOC104900919 [Beta vulgaris subsp. vulgaris]|uniref:uncharacterized protein LOC104900919 n=1 Tax=Beta vulgaris subsp. vulgaris TaxID=3555 RepID=UPI00053F35EB|nr:uncharacterized protein LOC104900919 [Beta vulgaris subsp. vulgaris]